MIFILVNKLGRTTEFERTEFIRLYEAGWSTRDIGKKIGVSATTVNKWIKRKSPELMRRGRFRRLTIKCPTDKAALGYLAGIVDGEGYIGRIEITYKNRKIKIGWKLCVANTNEELINWLKRIGGSVYQWKPRENRKKGFEWRLLRALDIHKFLKAILPYLIIKKKRAKDIVEEIEKRLQ